jgi:hypothetical protein
MLPKISFSSEEPLLLSLLALLALLTLVFEILAN